MNTLIRLLLFIILLSAWQVHAEATSCSEKSAQMHLDNTYQRLQDLYGIPAVSPPQIVIHNENLTVSDKDKTAIFGYFDSKTKTLHVNCNAGSVNSLEVSVGHEATHYYLDQAFGKLPLWLSEGLATYMEVGNNVEGSAANKMNRPRIKEFKGLLKHGRVPALVELLNQNPYSNNPSQYYASYWALVFSLMHHPNNDIQQQRRSLLLDLLNSPNRDLSTQNKQLIFGLLKNDTGTLGDWELAWRRQIWDLN